MGCLYWVIELETWCLLNLNHPALFLGLKYLFLSNPLFGVDLPSFELFLRRCWTIFLLMILFATPFCPVKTGFEAMRDPPPYNWLERAKQSLSYEEQTAGVDRTSVKCVFSAVMSMWKCQRLFTLEGQRIVHFEVKAGGLLSPVPPCRPAIYGTVEEMHSFGKVWYHVFGYDVITDVSNKVSLTLTLNFLG